MAQKTISRREFVVTGFVGTLAFTMGCSFNDSKSVVSVVKIKNDLIIAGTNPLATDMVAAHIMGFNKREVPTFTQAIRSGMKPSNMNEIEIRGEQLEDVQQKFKKPDIVPWNDIKSWYGVKEV